MLRSSRKCLLACSIVVLVLGPSSSSAEEGWKAGAAAIKVTPASNMWMAGYAARSKPAEGVLTELYAKALALEDPTGNLAVLVTLDLIGLDRDLSQSICRRLKELYGIERRQIALCCSHTHSGPVVARNLKPMHYLQLDEQQQRWVEQYAATLEQKVAVVVGEALANRSPSQLSWGSGTAAFAVNRRNNPEKDAPQLRAEGKLQGPIDHDVPVLAARDQQGQLTAVLFGYACHATTLSFYKWCGDYPGFAQMALQEDHPGAVALFWAGCGADQNPLPRRSVARAMGHGANLADSVNQVLQDDMQPITGSLQTSYREVDLPLAELPTRAQLAEDARSDNKYVATRAASLLAQIDAGQSLPGAYPYPVAVWRLGEQIQLVILGGEVVVDFAVRLKHELNGVRTWVAGYANDVMAYIASRRVLQEGGYEGATAMIYYGLPASWDLDSEEMIVGEVRRQIEQTAPLPLKTTAPLPAP